MDGSNLQSLDGTRIGRVIAVSAAEVVGLLEATPADPAGRAEAIEMGALVKLQTRASTVYGMVSALRVPLPSLSAPDEDLKIIQIDVLGETLRDSNGIDYSFQRGVSVFPAIEAPVYLATTDNVAQVYAPRGTAAVAVRTIYQPSTLPASLRIDA